MSWFYETRQYLPGAALQLWLLRRLDARLEVVKFDDLLRQKGVVSYQLTTRWDSLEVFVHAVSIGAAQNFPSFERELVGAIEHLGFQHEGWPVSSNVYRFKPLYTMEDIQGFLTGEVFPRLEKVLTEAGQEDLLTEPRYEVFDSSEEE